jgi:plasmid stability protein
MVAITIRDVPEDVRDELASRAARVGKSAPARARVEATAVLTQ